MQNHRPSALALGLLGLTLTGQGAVAATVDLSGTVRAVCSITGIETPLAVPISLPHRTTEVASVSVSSIGKTSLAVRGVTAFDPSGVQHVIPIHFVRLRANQTGKHSEFTKGSVVSIPLTRRTQSVSVSIASHALDGLAIGPYRFQVLALCAG